MLLDFTVGNFRSFYEKKTFSMEAQSLKEEPKENVAKELSYNVLKTMAFYGANSSGKSNLVKALLTMGLCVLYSVKLNKTDTLPYEPFLLIDNNDKPTVFEISFVKNNYYYRYGFSYTQTLIVEEWLFRKTSPRSKEQVLFIRNEDGIAYEDKQFPEGVGLELKLNNNRLFLSLCAQLGGDISNQVITWFESGINVVSGLNNEEHRLFSQIFFHKKKSGSKKALDFFKAIQLGFDDISTRERDIAVPDDAPKALMPLLKSISTKKRIEIESIHSLYNVDGVACGSVIFPFYGKESAGTKKLFDISGPIFDTLEGGYVLVIDELDAKMHPLISQQIISLFNNPKTNPNNAQLIFTTHDTHLLSTKMLRRDQIWFTEKNDVEQTDLYCLTDVVLPDGSMPRDDANLERNYIAGRYGAIPYIVND